MTLCPLVATLVLTGFNTSTLLAFSAVGYMAGPMALALPLVFLVGLAFYTATVAREWKRFDRTSVAELLGAAFAAFVAAVVIPGGLLSVVRADVLSFLVTIVLLP